jgi:hypothetical protein
MRKPIPGFFPGIGNRMPTAEEMVNGCILPFRLDRENILFPSVVSNRREGNDHQVISSDFTETLNQLEKIGADNIQDIPMSFEEIAIQIIKGEKGCGNY